MATNRGAAKGKRVVWFIRDRCRHRYWNIIGPSKVVRLGAQVNVQRMDGRRVPVLVTELIRDACDNRVVARFVPCCKRSVCDWKLAL